MTTFKRIVRPCTVPTYRGRRHAHCTIEYKDGGRLSITGVIGAMANGDCVGSCGQIDGSLREHVSKGEHILAPGWTEEMLARFLEIWDRWHLNDMRPCDSAMKRDGWDELAKREVFKHKFTLNNEAIKAEREAKDAAVSALRKDETFTPTPEQVRAVSRPFSVELFTDTATPPATPEHYEPSKRYVGKGYVTEGPERKTLGWVRPDEHPEGLLGKKHPETGNGYGSKWYREDVPADVLAFLQGLPPADVACAWRNL